MKNSNVDLLLVTFKDLGIALPDNVAAAAAERATIRAAARDIDPSNYSHLAAAWVTAVVDGKDPLDSPELTRAAVAFVLGEGNLVHAATGVVDERVASAIATSREQILADVKNVCDTAGATLADAHEVLGSLNLSETSSIFRLGPAAVEAHTKATAARRTILKVMTAWQAVADITGFTPTSSEKIDRLADLPLDVRNALRRNGDPWDIVQAGGTIDLAIDAATLRTRSERHTTEQRAAEANVRSDWSAQVHRVLGTGGPIIAGERRGK